MRLQDGALHCVIPCPVRMPGQRRLRALGIQHGRWLVRALVDGGTTQGRAVFGAIVAELGPVGRIADLGAHPDNGPDRGSLRLQVGDGGKRVRCVPDLGQTDQLGSDQKGIHTSGLNRKVGQMQDERIVAIRLGEEGVDLGGCRHCLVDRAGKAGRRRACDLGPRWIGRLTHAGGICTVRVGQGVAGGHIHQDQRMQQHLKAPRLEVRDGRDDRSIRGCATIGQLARRGGRDQGGGAAGHRAYRPVRGHAVAERALHGSIDLGSDRAIGTAQIIAEPRDGQGDGRAVGYRTPDQGGKTAKGFFIGRFQAKFQSEGNAGGVEHGLAVEWHTAVRACSL